MVENREFSLTSDSGDSGWIDWGIEWDFKGDSRLEKLLIGVTVASLLSLGLTAPYRWYGVIIRSVGFGAGLGYCLITKERRERQTVEEIEKKISEYQEQWERDKEETLSQIEQAEQGYMEEINRLTEINQQLESQIEFSNELVSQLQKRLKDDKKYLQRIWEFKQENPEDANKLSKIIPAVFYDWKPGSRLSGTKEYNDAKRYFVELDG